MDRLGGGFDETGQRASAGAPGVLSGVVTPRVSIGLPVFNGQPFLVEAIDCVLAQTFSDFELIISDNASTDETEAICRRYAEQDSRIRYYRNEVNLGAARNFNRCFELARGEYFKWIAADDLIGPEFISGGVGALDAAPAAALAYTLTQGIDASGEIVPQFSLQEPMVWPEGVVGRYRVLLEEFTFGKGVRAWPMVYIFGLMRSAALRRTALMQSYINSDTNLLAELALQGEFREVPLYESFIRQHEDSYSWGTKQDGETKQNFFDPARRGYWKIMLSRSWRYVDFYKGVIRSPLNPIEKLSLVMFLAGRKLRRDARWRSEALSGVPVQT